MNRLPALALLLLVSCASREPRREIPPEILKGRIAAAEDARSADFHLFIEAALSRDSAVHERAAVALGRIMNAESATMLGLVHAFSRDSRSRKAALFAMGQLGLTNEALPAEEIEIILTQVQGALDDPDEEIRATAVEAMGKLALERAPGMAVPFLKDPSALVRRQAASACFRWRQVLRWRDSTAKPPELPQEALDALSQMAEDSDNEVRWRSIHALHRSGSTPPPATVTRFLADPEPLCRLFALNLAERLKLKEVADEVARAQRDPDAQVRQASLRALVALGRPDLLDPKLVNDPSHHVRQAVADLVESEAPELEKLSGDPSPAVRIAALLARVRISGDAATPWIEQAISDPDPRIRSAAVRGAGALKEKGLSIVRRAREDSAEEVRAASLSVLGEIEGEAAWEMIRKGLAAGSLAERAGAAESLARRKEAGVLDSAIECFRNSSAREWVEIRESLIDLVAGQPPEKTKDFLLKVARDDPAPSVRQKAAAVLKRLGVKDVPEPVQEEASRTPHFGRRFASNPVVVVETTKGALEIECFAAEAPVHVANFVGLVEDRFYDGQAWHRAVPNFVIQGGDPLGNGMGDSGWSLRAEINPVPYRRGTLGMPRSAGFDTGGCQLFITHVPTPHLDGYYTVFGQVTQGLDVVDRIEVGDRIVRARLKR